MTTATVTRDALLDHFGRCYGAHRLAVAFTESMDGDGAKRCRTRGWETTAPLSDGPFGAALVSGRGRTRNPVIVLRPSRLIGLECDTPEDLAAIEHLGLPATATVRSSEPYKRHFYLRPPAELESMPFVAFRFESGRVTADASRYFCAPPSLHPSGRLYEFLPGLAVDEVGFAELPATAYRLLAARARGSDHETKAHIHEDPAAKVLPGNRRTMLFRYACALRRWTADRDEILQAALTWNARHCDPPVDQWQVAIQVDGAMRKQGSQALPGAA